MASPRFLSPVTVAAMSWLFAASCAADRLPAPDVSKMVEAKVSRVLRGGEPVTVRLTLPDDLAEVVRRLDPKQGPSLRLTLLGVETPKTECSVRVFVNHPEADASTALDDPRHLGDVGFYPSAPEGYGNDESASTGFLLDVGSALAALPPAQRLVEGKFLDVTLLLVPLRDPAEAAALRGIEVVFEGVRLSLHEPPDR